MTMAVHLLWLISTVVAVRAQTIDVDVLTDIFGTPPPTASSTPALQDIMVQPTSSPSSFTNSAGVKCRCVPYYLCDEQLNGVHANNASVTGWGELDIRLGEDHECQESVERCCTDAEVRPATGAPPTRPPIATRPCGLRNQGGLDFTLTGGSGAEAGFGEYPWVVALLDAHNDSYIGVGVIIHPSVVLTAAHVATKATIIKVRAGEWDTQTVKERLPHQERLTQEIVIHEDYRAKSLWNDGALLRLSSPLQPDEHVGAVCLPRAGEGGVEGEQGGECVANGWGKDVFGQPGRYAVILKRVEVSLVERARCELLLRRTRLGAAFSLHRSFLCAGGEQGRDTCQGDGGAPLACPWGGSGGSPRRYVLRGLVAWGIGCGQRDVPAVYVRLDHLRPWLDQRLAAWGVALDQP